MTDNERTSTATASDMTALRAEMKEWTLGIRCVFAMLNVLPLYYCTRVLLYAPQFQTIFEDMLGSKARVPLFTQLVLRFWLPMLVVVWLLAGLAVVLIFTLKRARLVWIAALITAFVFSASGHLVAAMVMDPVIAIIRNLSGGV